MPQNSSQEKAISRIEMDASADPAVAEAFDHWYRAVAKGVRDGTRKGSIAGALVVLQRLKDTPEFEIDAHIAPGGAQIKGAGGAAIKRILTAFDENRPFAAEGGRTNRGLRGHMETMLQVLCNVGIDAMADHDRVKMLNALQIYLVNRVQDFHNRKRLAPIFDPAISIRQIIAELLVLAQHTGKEGPVAQYLVRAKLQIRFPHLQISNDSYSTADVQLGRAGDFKVGDTAFHITVAPMMPVFDKCRTNIDAGLRVYLIVPDRAVIGARQIADQLMPGKYRSKR